MGVPHACYTSVLLCLGELFMVQTGLLRNACLWELLLDLLGFLVELWVPLHLSKLLHKGLEALRDALRFLDQLHLLLPVRHHLLDLEILENLISVLHEVLVRLVALV